MIFRAFIGPNLLLIFVNLIPIEPLDGAQAWKIFSPLRDFIIIKKQKSDDHMYDETVKKQIQDIAESNAELPNKKGGADGEKIAVSRKVRNRSKLI